MRRCLIVPVTLVTVLAVTGCEFRGYNYVLRLPGTEGGGSAAYQVEVELSNVVNLVPNSTVRVNDVVVGTVRDIRLQDWHAVVTVSLNGDVRLPANATAKIGQTSVLGAKHVELAPPTMEQPTGELEDGGTIPLSRTGRFPETEEVLAALSLVLNGAGLAQVRTIVSELNNAFEGRENSVRSVLDQLNILVRGLDAQKADIVSAIEGLNRLSGRLADQKEVLAGALDNLPPALAVLNRERADLTATLTALGNLEDVAVRVVNSSRADLLANLRDLEPALAALANAGQELADSLLVAGALIFPLRTYKNAFRGDYANLDATFDLTLTQLDNAFLSGTPLEGFLIGLEGLLGQLPGLGTQAANPLRVPVAPSPPPADPGPAQPAPASAAPLPDIPPPPPGGGAPPAPPAPPPGDAPPLGPLGQLLGG
jgi:phospholipid/cholesterol/gamma-HCH transport system substrate-binding protein